MVGRRADDPVAGETVARRAGAGERVLGWGDPDGVPLELFVPRR